MEKPIFQRPGIESYDLDTPALLVDVDKLESNIKTFSGLAEAKNLRLVPHLSIHGSLDILKSQLQNSNTCRSICCDSISEADNLSNLDLNEIIIKSTPISKNQLQKMWALNETIPIHVVIRDTYYLKLIQENQIVAPQKVGVIIQLPTVLESNPQDTITELLQMITECNNSSNIDFKGLLIDCDNPDVLEAYIAIVRIIKTDWPRSKAYLLGESSLRNYAKSDLIDYLIAGCYPIPDILCIKEFPELSISASVLSQIISKPTPDHLVIDSGHKTFGTDLGMPAIIPEKIHPYTSALSPTKFSAEHGAISFPEDLWEQIQVQQKIKLVPNSMELCVNQFDTMRFVKEDKFIGYRQIISRGLYS